MKKLTTVVFVASVIVPVDFDFEPQKKVTKGEFTPVVTFCPLSTAPNID
jgi:hypothetical protein